MPSNSNREDAWHQQSVQQVLDGLGVDRQNGLARDSVAARARRYGLNEIEQKARRGLWRIFAIQFADFMIFVLVAEELEKWQVRRGRLYGS